MKRSLLLLVAPGALLWAVGCGHTPAAPPREVRFVTESELVLGCVALGKVTGESSYGGITGQQLGKVRAEAEMRENARSLGADVVLVQTSRGGFWGANSVGEAFSCKDRVPVPVPIVVPQPVSPPPDTQMPARGQGGCEKDTDCKGDRVCENGRCVNP